MIHRLCMYATVGRYVPYHSSQNLKSQITKLHHLNEWLFMSVYFTANILIRLVFDALSTSSGLAAAVLLCMTRV